MKRKTQKQFNEELMHYLISKKLSSKKLFEILRACFEKRFYEKTKKLH